MFYEYRRYEITPGKAGALHARFRDVTLPIWAKHGIRVVGFFEAYIGTNNVLHYILQWEDLAEREKKWDVFQSDPDWTSQRDKSEENGPLVRQLTSSIWRPTPYSEQARAGLHKG